MRSPPLVCGSHTTRIHTSRSSGASHEVNSSAHATTSAVRPGTTPCSAYETAFSNSGTSPPRSRPQHRSPAPSRGRGPTSPNPVMSVAAWTATCCIASAAAALSAAIDSMTSRTESSVLESVLQRGADDAGADGLGEVQRVAGAGSSAVDDLVGVDDADHRQAVLGLLVVDGVPPDHHRAGLADLLGAAAHDLAHDLGAEGTREREQVHRGERTAAHRVDVGQRVGGGDATEVVGVVDDGREEVDGKQRCRLVVEAVDGSVVARLEALHEGLATGPGRSCRARPGGPPDPTWPLNPTSSTAVSAGCGRSCLRVAPCGGRPPRRVRRRSRTIPFSLAEGRRPANARASAPLLEPSRREASSPAASSSAGNGVARSARRNPCPNRTPSARSVASSASVSIPSAMSSDPTLAAERDERLDEPRAHLVAIDTADEREVDLQPLGTHLGKRLQRAVARARVVDRDREAERAQVLEGRAERREVVDRAALGELEHDLGRARATAPSTSSIDMMSRSWGSPTASGSMFTNSLRPSGSVLGHRERPLAADPLEPHDEVGIVGGARRASRGARTRCPRAA